MSVRVNETSATRLVRPPADLNEAMSFGLCSVASSRWSWLVVCATLCASATVGAQTPVGALAIDERQGDQYGWAVDYETAAAAWATALRECGAGCSVVLTFERCGAYAADQDANSTAAGWAQSYDSAARAREAALSDCHARGGGSGCIVRAWGCNGHVVEEGLGLDRATRRQIQQGLRGAGFDPGGADGVFGPRTRAAIRNWQSARATRATGYLDGPSAAALRSAGDPAAAAPRIAPSAPAPSSAGTAAQDNLFWQSIMNSTDRADFEAYLRQFPNGAYRALAENRLARLREPATDRPQGAQPGPARFGGDPVCTRQSDGVSCWMEVADRPGCYVWNPNPHPGETVGWTGACAGGFAQGMGSLTFSSAYIQQTVTGGSLRDGRFDGTWTITNRRAAGGPVLERFEQTYADGQLQDRQELPEQAADSPAGWREQHGRACEIPGYPRPANLPNLGLNWCGSSVDFQRRAFALQAAGAWCAIAEGTSSTPAQVAARHQEIDAACDALDALGNRGGPPCGCPEGYRP